MDFACLQSFSLININILSISHVWWFWNNWFVIHRYLGRTLPIHFADSFFSITFQSLDNHVNSLGCVWLISIFYRLYILFLFSFYFLQLPLFLGHQVCLIILLFSFSFHVESLICLFYLSNPLCYLFLHNINTILLLLVVNLL